MKKNFRRLFVIFCVTALLFASIGCDRSDGKLPDTDGKSEAQTEDKVIPQDPGTETEKPSDETDPGNADAVSFRADLYFQEEWLSSMYSFDVEIKDGKIYIDGTLYEQETPSASPEIIYSEPMLLYAERRDKEDENLKISETLNKIKESEAACILHTDGERKSGIIAVYKFDGAYYFVRFLDNGNAIRIHRAVIEGTADV